ncbi:NAD(P)/FAD-dependent oxidoreductase [Geodermatophilus marinus]|uniref:NAD(P)/FAD-dependent oxidoreductase n=1 Tax=Geodermatophilus sp. LHW52908 TaxID=2303986 RepID=UPI0018F77B44|nr:FAD-dependent oxidoreductase [Geodermatophilus sp. LHW52908]
MPSSRQHRPAPASGSPRQVAVIGAGMVGLSCTWFLQEAGVQVTVCERASAGAGASWGNAGWLAPAPTAPLPEPSVLRHGLRAVVSPRSPVYLPPRADRTLLRFLAGFVAHSTPRRWRAGMAAYAPVNARALEAFDVLAAAGVPARTRPARPFLACFRRAREAERLCAELEAVRAAGQEVSGRPVTGRRAREMEPALTDRVGAAVDIRGQRSLHPPEHVRALAAAVRQRGGELVEGSGVADLGQTRGGVTVVTAAGQHQRHDAVVVATGAELGRLAGRFGVRQPVQAGRGCSFSVPVDRMPRGPLHFPAQRVACTPMGDRLRLAGMMEFRRPGDPLDPRRTAVIVDAVRPFLAGADLDDRCDEWVGSRPCTPGGLPLLGATASPRVFVAGGHGMWGIVLGPVTGQLVARTVLKGRRRRNPHRSTRCADPHPPAGDHRRVAPPCRGSARAAHPRLRPRVRPLGWGTLARVPPSPPRVRRDERSAHARRRTSAHRPAGRGLGGVARLGRAGGCGRRAGSGRAARRVPAAAGRRGRPRTARPGVGARRGPRARPERGRAGRRRAVRWTCTCPPRGGCGGSCRSSSAPAIPTRSVPRPRPCCASSTTPSACSSTGTRPSGGS